MLSIISGFTTILVVIGVGWAAARRKILCDRDQLTLANVSFYIGTPCLMVTVMLRLNITQVFSAPLIISLVAALVTAGVYLLTQLLWWRRDASDAVVATFASCYVNSANIGLPIAAFVLHDTGWMAPILMFQTLIIQPIGLTILDVQEARAAGVAHSGIRRFLLPLSNPITIGTMIGLTLNMIQLKLPPLLLSPIELMGQLSIPAMLLAFGVSLHENGWPGHGEHSRQMWAIVAIKLVFHPVFALILAGPIWQLPKTAVLACAVIAALPSAQNIFVIAQRYRVAINLARDAIFIDTLLSIPVLFVIATALGT